MNALRVEVAELRVEIRHLTETMQSVKKELVTRPEHFAHGDRIKKLEDDKTWLVRGVIGAWLAGIAVVFKKWM